MMKPMESPLIVGSTARKRRREILTNKATKVTTTPLVSPTGGTVMDNSSPVCTINKKIRTSTEGTMQTIPMLVTHNQNIDAALNLQSSLSHSKLLHSQTIKKEGPPKLISANASVVPMAVKSVQLQVITSSSVKKTNTKTPATKKKPQMRYDPAVPMTKEEAAIWRREQRRKRNRDSAAASRQRQRNRISELEEEVTEWKQKFEEAMAKLAKQEAELKELTQLQRNHITTSTEEYSSRIPSSITSEHLISDGSISDDSNSIDDPKLAMAYPNDCCPVSPSLNSQESMPAVSHFPPDVLSLSYPQGLQVNEDVGECIEHHGIKVEDEQQYPQINVVPEKAKNLIEISKPAVKITGTLPFENTTSVCGSGALSQTPFEQCPLPSITDESLESMIPPNAMEEEAFAQMPDLELTDSEFPLDIMDFPTEEDDLDLGAFLSEATDWL